MWGSHCSCYCKWLDYHVQDSRFFRRQFLHHCRLMGQPRHSATSSSSSSSSSSFLLLLLLFAIRNVILKRFAFVYECFPTVELKFPYCFLSKYFELLRYCIIGVTKRNWYSAGLRAGWSGGSCPGRGWEFLFSLSRPDRFWCPPNLLSNGYERLLSWG
jgi:hypothetical protein